LLITVNELLDGYLYVPELQTRTRFAVGASPCHGRKPPPDDAAFA